MNTYKVLNKQVFSSVNYTLVPIRMEDRYTIMKWRNEQIYHLRQNKILTEAEQDAYFENVVSKLFDLEKPNQVLFSYLENEKCIGYGGLVHINWTDRNAEISFIMDTALEKNFFSFHWQSYLSLIEKVAFEELNLHKIFTYAYDIRPMLYEALEGRGYDNEAKLKEHCFFEGRFIDVLIHSKTKNSLFLRDAIIQDLSLTYSWANHPQTRKYAFSQEFIPFENHQNWFTQKIADRNCIYKLLVKGVEPVGSIRFDINEGEGLISYLIAPHQTGKGYGKRIVEFAITDIVKKRPDVIILKGFVKEDNLGSIKIFEKLGFDRLKFNSNVFEYRLNIGHADSKF